VRLPPELTEHAFFVEQTVRQRLTRGRFEVGVRIEGAALPSPRLSLERARALYTQLASLRDEVAPGTELPVSSMMALPGLVDQPSAADTAAMRAALERAVKDAVGKLDEMRRREGDALKQELGRRLAAARCLRDQVAERSCEATPLFRERLRERLQRLLDDVNTRLDAGRLEMELALLADRTDITEELARLESHFGQFGLLLDAEDAVGRRLDFLLQEVSRESNTIGAKCQAADLSHLVVDLKSEVERMREQVQNVE
jgi:uncharacterized protein (TIGR00255 family)